MSPISSRNSVPPSACSNRPRRIACAPVNAPRSWPKSSLSRRSFGIAAVLIAMNGFAERGLCRCSARATSSLPVPDSPMISTVAVDVESRPIARKTSCIAGAWPRISGEAASDSSAAASCRLSSSARRISSTAWSTSNGFGRYSNAPPWNAATADSRSEYAVMMITGSSGCFCFTLCNTSRPEVPGIRISDTSTCGVSLSSAVSASCASPKVLNGMPSRVSAFSNTQRIERSSSITHTGFIGSPVQISVFRLRLARERQHDPEHRPPRLAVALDRAVVVLHERLRQRESEPRPALAAGYERMEHTLAQLGRDPRTVVDHLQFQCQPVPPARDRDGARDPRPQHDLAGGWGARTRAGARLRGVAHDVQHRLDQLLAVALDLRQARVVVAHDADARRKLREDEAAHPFADFVDVHRADVRRTVRRQEPVHQELQPVGLLDDHLRVLAQ